MATLIFLRHLCECVWVNILTLSPPRDTFTLNITFYIQVIDVKEKLSSLHYVVFHNLLTHVTYCSRWLHLNQVLTGTCKREYAFNIPIHNILWEKKKQKKKKKLDPQLTHSCMQYTFLLLLRFLCKTLCRIINTHRGS